MRLELVRERFAHPDDSRLDEVVGHVPAIRHVALAVAHLDYEATLPSSISGSPRGS